MGDRRSPCGGRWGRWGRGGRAAGLRLPFLPELGAAARGRQGSGAAAVDPPAPPNGVGAEKGSWAGRTALGRASGLALEARGAGRGGGVRAAGHPPWSAGGRVGPGKVPSRSRRGNGGLGVSRGRGCQGLGETPPGAPPLRGEQVRDSGEVSGRSRGHPAGDPDTAEGGGRGARMRKRPAGRGGGDPDGSGEGRPRRTRAPPPGRGEGALSPGRCWRPRWGSAGGCGREGAPAEDPRRLRDGKGGNRARQGGCAGPRRLPRDCERATHSCPRRFSGGPGGLGG